MNSDIAQLRRHAKRQGWPVLTNGAGHLEWQAPDGRIVITPAKILRPDTIRRVRHALRKAGLQFEGRTME